MLMLGMCQLPITVHLVCRHKVLAIAGNYPIPRPGCQRYARVVAHMARAA